MGISRGPLHWDNKDVMLSEYVNRMIQGTYVLSSNSGAKYEDWASNSMSESMFYLLLV